MTTTYNAHGPGHTGTTGFTNYFPGTDEQLAAALDRVFAEHPDAVVLDGDDDWYACDCHRPATFPHVFGIEPIAYFHTGISGISKSGIVVSREDFERLERDFPTTTFEQIRKPDRTGLNLRECVRVYDGRETR